MPHLFASHENESGIVLSVRERVGSDVTLPLVVARSIASRAEDGKQIR